MTPVHKQRFRIHAMCPQCALGSLVADWGRPTPERTYAHYCPKCGHRALLPQPYPRVADDDPGGVVRAG